MVGQARDGVEAVKAASELAPDLIVMDVMMPKEDGVEACREIMESLPETRVLMLTASTEANAVIEAVAAGPEPVDAGGQRGGETVDAGHRVHPADDQRQPLPGRGGGVHEVRWGGEAERPGGFADTLGCQVVSLARRQVGGAVTHPPDDALGQSRPARVRWTVV